MSLFSSKRFTPIGLDIGCRSIKIAQLELAGAGQRVSALAQFELPLSSESPEERREKIQQGLRQLTSRGLARGRDVVLGLNSQQLFVQNVRLPRIAAEELSKMVRWEAEERLPSDFGVAEIRHLIAGDIRSSSGGGEGPESRQEVILLACRRREIDELIDLLESARLRPQGIDIPACAVVRASQNIMRRKTDEQTGLLFIDMGAATTSVVVTRGPEILLIKPLSVGGLSMDRLVARKLNLSIEDANLVRRQWADGAADAGSPDLARSVAEAVRSEIDTLVNEIVMCLRYHSVTFRGNRIAKGLLFGGEAHPELAQQLSDKLDIPCELGDPFVGLEIAASAADQIEGKRRGHWAVALGLCTKQRVRAA